MRIAIVAGTPARCERLTKLRRRSWIYSAGTPAFVQAAFHAARKSRMGFPLGHVNTYASGALPAQHASTALRTSAGIATLRALLFFVAPANRLIQAPATCITKRFLSSAFRNPSRYAHRIR